MGDDFDFSPDWAIRFNYPGHSPSGTNRPTELELFDKIIARPEKLYAPGNANMVGGRAVESYCSAVVVDGMDEKEGFAHALSVLDAHVSPKHMPDDESRMNLFRDELVFEKIKGEDPQIKGTHFELICNHALQGLREATQGANLIEDGRWCSVYLEGVLLPFIGELDFEAAGAVVELKTKWPYLAADSKQGWRTNSLPKRPTPEHTRQVALYWHWLKQSQEEVPVKLIYANTKGFIVFTNDNCEDLTEENLFRCLTSLQQVAKARESLMAASADADQLFSMVAADFSHWMWKDKPPEYMARARQVLGG